MTDTCDAARGTYSNYKALPHSARWARKRNDQVGSLCPCPTAPSVRNLNEKEETIASILADPRLDATHAHAVANSSISRIEATRSQLGQHIQN